MSLRPNYGVTYDGAARNAFRAGAIGVTAYPFAMAVKFKTADANVAGGMMASIVDKDVGTTYFGIKMLNQKVGIIARDSVGAEQAVFSTGNYNDNVEHSAVALFISATDRRLYIDYNLEAVTDVVSVTFSNTIDQYGVGCNKINVPASFFNGLVDDVRVWFSTLTANERRGYHNAGQPLGGNTIATTRLCLKCDENTGTTLTDTSGNAYNATLSDALGWTADGTYPIASFTAGYGLQVTVSDNGAGKVRITFAPMDFAWQVYDLMLTTGAHYFYDQNLLASYPIIGKGCVSATAVTKREKDEAGYYFDLDETFVGTAISTGHTFMPSWQAAPNNYTGGTATAYAQMAVLDAMLIGYCTSTLCPTHNTTIAGGGTKVVSAYGLLAGARVNIASGSYGYYVNGDFTTQTEIVTLSNFSVGAGNATNYAFRIAPTVEGAGFVLEYLTCIGGGFGFGFSGVTTAAKNKVRNCETIYCYVGAYPVTPATFQNCTFAYGYFGVGNNNIAGVYTNIICLQNRTDWVSMTNATVTYSCSNDNTCPAGTGNRPSTSVPDSKLWSDNDSKNCWPNARILTTSALFHAGTPVVGCEYDIDGNLRHVTTPSQGAHEGTTYAYQALAPAIPAGFALTDAGTNGELLASWTNASAYGVLCAVVAHDNGTGLELARGLASVGSLRIPGLTVGVSKSAHMHSFCPNSDLSTATGVLSATPTRQTITSDWVGRVSAVASGATGFYQQVCDAIRSRFRTEIELGIPVLTGYDNAPFERTDNTQYVRCSVILGEGSQASMGGSNRRFRANGIMMVNIYVPVEKGAKDAIVLADRIVLAFRAASFSSIQFRTPSLGRLGREGSLWTLTVSCPFYADTIG